MNVPLSVWMALPSADGPDPNADPNVRIESSQWPATIDESMQATWGAKWLALAVAKPFVRTINWLQASDAAPHLYPHAGLIRPDQTAKTAACMVEDVAQGDAALNCRGMSCPHDALPLSFPDYNRQFFATLGTVGSDD